MHSDSILRNETQSDAKKISGSEQAMSCDEQEKLTKRSDGTFFINNITNNFIVDKKQTFD